MAMARMAITLDDFLEHAEQLTDRVLQSGIPLEIRHEGRILRLVPPPLVITSASDDLENVDWSQTWRPKTDS